ncbi:hypothetical protein SELMODRAFT_100125 [Selaginella moellendorffii]|uniref:Pentacotripeptide-repeat region of PRORP domain-containing protein n=1 Tax=Selaginella moellendorffii TaxID=88036 RepID=D8RRS0_SELML|nr:hypothetical protein SELMODRAFT_118248 [Selaginella moellendorffii]EFJ24938.1 hypothetical protein SELMODRAFT_100125 [Selaginella moellendorffii]
MYGKCSAIDDACFVFESIRKRNVFSWTMMISAFAQNGHFLSARLCFWKMNLEGIKPDRIALIATIDALAEIASAADIVLLRTCVHELGLASDLVLKNALLNLYSIWLNLQETKTMFERLETKDVITWTCMISAYARKGHPGALLLFRRMELEGIVANGITYIALCTALSKLHPYHHIRINLLDLETRISRSGLLPMVCCSLIEMYGNLGDIENAMRLIHERIVRLGLNSHSNLVNTLINMYGKCDRVDIARGIFDSLDKKCVVSWTAMITANAQNGHPLEAFHLFCRMSLEGILPTKITLITLLDASSLHSDILRGKLVHECIEDLGLDLEGALGNALVNMYGKCGNTSKALSIFESMQLRDACAWNTMLAAYAQVGHIHSAFEKLQEMELQGVRATDTTFINILSALSHAGSLHRCCDCLISMIQDYNVTPASDHYRCIVDMLARLGQLQHANELMELMPFEPTATAWMSLLAASRVHTKTSSVDQVSWVAAERVFELEPRNASPYLALSNIYKCKRERI